MCSVCIDNLVTEITDLESGRDELQEEFKELQEVSVSLWELLMEAGRIVNWKNDKWEDMPFSVYKDGIESIVERSGLVRSLDLKESTRDLFEEAFLNHQAETKNES